jgi:hypothetical protein
LGKGERGVHDVVDFVDCEGAVDVFHGFAGVLHGEEGLLVDVGGFDGVDLVLQHGDLRGGLFEGVLVCLFAFERRAGGWERWTLAKLFIYIEPNLHVALRDPLPHTAQIDSLQGNACVERSTVDNLPVLLLDTFALAIFSCSAIWFSKCFSRFCSMSSCCRRSRIAFLGASFRFCVPLPPNHVPHIVVVFVFLCSTGAWLLGCTRLARSQEDLGSLC